MGWWTWHCSRKDMGPTEAAFVQLVVDASDRYRSVYRKDMT